MYLVYNFRVILCNCSTEPKTNHNEFTSMHSSHSDFGSNRHMTLFKLDILAVVR